ncbi:MAG: RHS repeat-associated core domain-containing protein [Sandaracinaceae bacterium]
MDVVTGANTFREVDFEVAAPFELFFYRHYDSRWCRDNRGLGPGFRHGFDHWLIFDLDGVTYRDSDGSDKHFPHLVADGQRFASGGCWLERVTEERYVLTRHARPTMVFRRPPGDIEAELVELRQLVDGVERRVPVTYDAQGKLSQILVAHDDTLRLDWDEQGYLHGVRRLSEGDKREWLVRYHYENGYLVAATDMYGHSFRLEYDQAGRVRRRVDRRGFGFQFEYDEAGRCISSVGDDGTLAVSLTYKPLEYETRVLDANAAEWVYQYDKSGAVVLITDPYGGVRYFKTGDDGRVLREYDANGGCTTYLHDEAGAPVAKIDPQGHVTQLPEPFPPKKPGAHRVPKLPIEWELGDLWERDFKLPDPHELPFDLPAEVRDALTVSDSPQRGTVQTVCDFQGHRVREEVESGAARAYGYNANGGLETVVDMQGGAWRIDVDGFNDIVAETDPLGGTLRYRYSQTRAMVAALDQAGTETEYDRDLKDRITAVRRDGELRETYAWDPADHLIEKRDALGEVMLEIERDTAGRPVVKKLASGEQHELVYDEAGRLTEARTSRGRCTFAYDWAGRRTEDKRDGKGVEHRFALDRVRSTTVLGRFRTEYRDTPGGGVSITDPTGREHVIRSHGRGLFTRDFANGVSETVQYHPRAGRVLAKVLFRRDAHGHAWARRYQYSDEGELRLVIDSDAGPSRYEHDAALRLAKATQPDGRTAEFRYNAAGTLFQSSTLQGGTVGKQNQLRQANGERYAYNHRGHLSERVSSRGKISYDYDSLDQLSVVFWEGPNGERWGWDADYDPLGRRTRKAPGYTNETHFYWDTDRLAAEVFSDGRVRVYVYPDAFSVVPLLFAEYESEDADPSSGQVYYCFTDQRGAVQRVLDDDGAVVWSAKLEPYGYVHVEQGADFHQPLRFPGHYFDSETGLHQNRFRYYDPLLGRYLQVDPTGLRGGGNLYAHTANPLVQVDLRGLTHQPSPTRRDDGGEIPDGTEHEAQPGTTPPAESVRVVPPPRTILGGLTPELAALSSRSEQLRTQIAAHEARGGRVEMAAPGVGTHYDPTTRTVRVRPDVPLEQQAAGLAHELGHANDTSSWVPPTGLSEQEYVSANVDREMRGEGLAQLNNLEVRDQIMRTGGPDIGISGTQDAGYQSAYDRHKSGDLTRDEVVGELGRLMGSETTGTTGQPYHDYYGDHYRTHYNSTGGSVVHKGTP